MTLLLLLAPSLVEGLAQEGLAAKYPGDEGIEADPRVLFVEDFETGDAKELGARWGNASNPENMSFPEDLHADSPGKRSIRIAKNGHLYTHTRGVDRLHARFYVKFHEKTGYIHHFVHLAADRTPTPWPKGGAGKRPAGDQGFSSGIEPWGKWGEAPAPGVWHFYSYWQEMKGDPKGNYWGNHFEAPQDPIQPGRWYCVEAMMQANSAPEKADGEQAFWVDGKKLGHFTGIRWRSTDQLKLNTFWLLYYITDQAARHNKDTATDRVMEVGFDDVVLATDYIGPVVGKPKSGKKVATPGRTALAEKLPEKVVFSESFDSSPGPFKGEVQDGALALPPKGLSAWNAWKTPVGETTTVRFRVKPLVDIEQLTVMIWSDKLKDNGRFYVTGLKKGEWKDVRFKAIEVRQGWAMDGPSIDGSLLNNLTLNFEGAPEARVLVDDLEIRE